MNHRSVVDFISNDKSASSIDCYNTVSLYCVAQCKEQLSYLYSKDLAVYEVMREEVPGGGLPVSYYMVWIDLVRQTLWGVAKSVLELVTLIYFHGHQ